MCRLHKTISPALMLSTAFWVADASAVSVPYHADSHAAKGAVNFPPLPESPFASLLGSKEEHRAEILQSLKGRKSNPWDKHTDHGKGHGNPGDRDADSNDKPSPPLVGAGDDIGSDIGDTTPTPLPSDYPPITPSPSAVPLPAAVWLFVSGLIGLGATGRLRRR